MKKYERWYDKYTDISQLFYFLESLDERKRKIVANEILQIIFCELNLDSDEKVKELTFLKHEHDKRWYDVDVDVQSSIELIKNLSEEERREMLSRIIETLRQFIIKGRFE